MVCERPRKRRHETSDDYDEDVQVKEKKQANIIIMIVKSPGNNK